MICSLARREATPASARNFWSRTTRSKSEIRMAKPEGNPKVESRTPKIRARSIWPSVFGLRISVSGVFFRLAQPSDPFAWFPLAALLEQFQTFKAFQDISFAAQGGRRAQ